MWASRFSQPLLALRRPLSRRVVPVDQTDPEGFSENLLWNGFVLMKPGIKPWKWDTSLILPSLLYLLPSLVARIHPVRKWKIKFHHKDVFLWQQLFLRKGQFTYRYAFIALFSSNSLNDKNIHQFIDFGVEVSDSRCTSGGRNNSVSLPLQWHR